MTRSLRAVALCGGLVLGAFCLPARGAEVMAVPDQAPSGFDAVGRLMPNEESDASRRSAPFVLVDKDGVAQCYVISRAGADLSDFVEKRVGVRGAVRFVAGDPLPLIMAGSVQPVAESVALKSATSNRAKRLAEERSTPETPEPVQRVAHSRRAQGPQEPTLAELPAPEIEALLALPPEDERPEVDADPEAVPSDLADFGPELADVPKVGCDCEECGGTNCTSCSECCLANDPGRWFVRAEYLAWATKGMYIPPLATTGPGASNPGILGQPGTVILFGNEAINGEMRSGGRIALGTWLNPEQTWGLSAEYFGLADAGESFFAASDANGVPTISRPYFTVFGIDENGDLKPPGQNAQLVALEDVLAGSLRVETNTSLQGGGVFLRRTFCCSNRCWSSCDGNHTNCTDSCCDEASSGVPGGLRVGMFGGYRFMLLDDGVSITEDLTAISTSPADQGRFLINDSFSSNNQFHGGELGFIAEARRARWTMELISRLALGNNYQTVDINGSTVISGSQQDDGTYQGGLLALPTNIGSYSRNQFSVIPQINANLGYNLTPRMRVILGYTFLYWGNVARAGEQISLDVNETYIPAGFAQPEGPNRPAFVWRPNDFWAQGLNVGLDYFW